MKPLTVYIVEDEAPARERLMAFVEAHPNLTLVGWSANGEQAIKEIPRLKPHVVFLDVQLGDISGLDVLKMLPRVPHVIFSTAYEQYAVQAFEHNAVDYLLKPYSFDRFSRAVKKLLQTVATRTSEDTVQTVTQEVRLHHPLTRIPARVGERIYILPVEEIVYFSSENKVVMAHRVDKAFIINYTLEELEHRLDSDRFFRIHRSTIVNLDYVHSIEPYFGGTYVMTVNDKKHTQLPISRNAARRLRERLGW